MVSVIIPAHDEEKYIGPSIERLMEQKDVIFIGKDEDPTDFKNAGRAICEIIVAVTHGDDDTEGVASGYPGVHVVSDNFSGVSEARNVGKSLARGDVLMFLDADTLLSYNFLKRLEEFKNDTDFIGTSKLFPDIKTLKARLFMFGNNVAHKLTKTSMALIFCHRDVYDAVGGFDEAMPAGEDLKFIHLALKKGSKFKYLGDISAETSMRRFETVGYMKTALEWMGGYFFKPADHYDVVR